MMRRSKSEQEQPQIWSVGHFHWSYWVIGVLVRLCIWGWDTDKAEASQLSYSIPRVVWDDDDDDNDNEDANDVFYGNNSKHNSY